MIDNISSLTYLNALGKPKTTDSPEKIKAAAQQFEAILIGQLLKTAKASGSAGWLGTGEGREDEPGQVSVDMAEQQLASVIAKNGGLGLTKFIVKGLEKKP
jgi:Rod binding domain-containing protein